MASRSSSASRQPHGTPSTLCGTPSIGSQLTPWDPTNPAAQEEPIFVTTVRDASTKDGFFGGLELRKKEMLAGAALTGKVISLKGPKKIKKADRPRGAKKSKDERNFKALVTVRTSGIRPCCALGSLPSR